MAEAPAVQTSIAPPQVPDTEHAQALKIVETFFPKKEKQEAKPEAKPEVKPGPEQTETVPEKTEAQETTQELTQEAPRKLKLKYKGEEVEKDEAEVISLAQQGFDYTQKSQSLAKEREEVQTKIKSAIDPALKEYAEKLQLYEQAVWQALAPEVRNTDWNALARDDPAMWAQRMQAVTNVNNILAAIQKERQALSNKQESERKTAFAKHVEEAREVLERDVPEWSDVLYQKILRAGVDYGFKPDEVGAITDPRSIKVLHAAMKYMELQKAKPEVEKKVVTVPKVIQPGTAEKPNPDADRYHKAMDNLRKTGRDEEAHKVAKLILG